MKKVIFVIIISSIFLSSCNTIRSSAGVERKVIDEYNVVENPPLVIPPNFNLLPPDQIESKDIDDTDSELAKEILLVWMKKVMKHLLKILLSTIF